MRRAMILIPIVGALAFGGLAGAHQCDYDGAGFEEGNQSNCRESEIAPNWRDGNYVPLFDLADRDDPQQRRDAQRWRDECQGTDGQGRYHDDQQCAWVRGGSSLFARPDDPHPNEYHVGYAASHCFLMEAAHDCSDHDSRRGESVHDTHGGATYVDVCLTANPESKWCDDGMKDTQVGLTVMDHLNCGLIVPIVSCIDEYHVVRPFDQDYTEEQMEDSVVYIGEILDDPELYLCGYRERRGGGNPICPRQGDGPLPGDGQPNAQVGTKADPARVLALRAEIVHRFAKDGVPPSVLLAALDRAARPTGDAGAGAWLALVLVAAAVVMRRTMLAR